MNAIVIKSADVESAKLKFGEDLVTEVFTDTQSTLPWDLHEIYKENGESQKIECLRCLFGDNLEQKNSISL